MSNTIQNTYMSFWHSPLVENSVQSGCHDLNTKIKKDLSSLDKNTIYLMRFTFGPSEIPQWKREQFPNVKYDEYEYLKGSMNDVNQMAFQFFVNRESIKYQSATVSDINVVPVSHEFIEIEGLEFDEV